MSLLDKLNLRPQERRFVVLAGLVVFVVINIWLIWPHFNDWQNFQNRNAQVEKTLKMYQAELARVPGYQSKLTKLQQSGSSVLTEELELQRMIQNQAASNSVLVTRYDPRAKSGGGRTNQFFEDQLLTIDCSTGPKELVSFLVSLASGNSMVRVREMNLKPDPSQTKLLATITFVASYQKKAPPKTAATQAAAAGPVAAKNPAPPAQKPPAQKAAPQKPAAGKTNAPASRQNLTNAPAKGTKPAVGGPKK